MNFNRISLPCSLLCLVILAVGGCHRDHEQSMLHPAGPAAAHIAWLWWVLFGICTAVFVITMLLLAVAIFRRPAQPAPQSPLGNKFIILSGIVLPGMILLGLVAVTVHSQVALEMPQTELTIRVVGHMWWWEVHYPDHQIVTANEFYIPVGEPVRIELISADVIHSLWVPNLQGKMDLLPEKTMLALT
jgi:cytochrome c oxidase subunit 2